MVHRSLPRALLFLVVMMMLIFQASPAMAGDGETASLPVAEDEVSSIDLVAVSISITVPLVSGAQFNARISISNQGSEESGSFHYSILLSDDKKFDTEDPVLMEGGPVSVGPRATLSREVKITAPALSSDSYLLLVVDTYDEVEEREEGNNIVASQKVWFDAPVTDLKATSIKLDGELSATYSNDGSVDPGEFGYRVQLSDDQTPSSDDTVLMEGTDSLAPGEEGIAHGTVELPKSGYLLLIVDPEGEVEEDDESNNLASAWYEGEARAISVTSPGGGEEWEQGSVQEIAWTWEGDIERVDLTLLHEGETTIALGVKNSGAYTWTVPSLQGHDFEVRVSDHSDPHVTDVSGEFSITVPLDLGDGSKVSILAGEVNGITLSSSMTFEVTAGGSIAGALQVHTVNLWPSSSVVPLAVTPTWGTPSTAYRGITADVEAGEKVREIALSLTAPSVPGTYYIVVAMRDESAYANVMSATSSSLGAVWNDGNDIARWSGSTIAACMVNGHVQADWLTGGGHVTLDVPADAVKVVVKDAPSLTLVSPNGGEGWEQGSTQEIVWTSTGELDMVRLDLLRHGAEYAYIGTVENDGSYEYVVPLTGVVGDGYTVRVRDPSGTGVYDLSDSEFEVIARRTITVLSPSGGEEWLIGSMHELTWMSTGDIPMVDIYLLSGGMTVPVASSEANDGSYTWTIPTGLDPGHFNLVVAASDDDASQDISSRFTIAVESEVPWIAITSPSGGEMFSIGQVVQVTWSSSDGGGVVTLQLYRNGSYHSSIASPTENDGIYQWTVPDVPGEYAIYVYSYSNSAINDLSEAFTITDEPVDPTIRITAPAGDECWTCGSVQRVTWESFGGIDLVSLEIMGDAGTVVLAESTINDGHFLCQVPDLDKGEYRLRVSDLGSDASSEVTVSVVDPMGSDMQLEGLDGTMLTIMAAFIIVAILAVIRFHSLRKD